MESVRESDVLRDCLQYLQLKVPHLLFWRQNAGVIPTADGKFRRFVGRKGLPDIWLFLPPHATAVAIECKVPGKDLSPDQVKFHEQLVSLGGVSIVVHSVDELAEDLEELLKPCAAEPSPVSSAP